MPELPLALVRAATATPSPTPTYDPDSITPGFAGFVAIALLAVVVIFLIIDMLRRCLSLLDGNGSGDRGLTPDPRDPKG